MIHFGVVLLRDGAQPLVHARHAADTEPDDTDQQDENQAECQGQASTHLHLRKHEPVSR
jgi:hypothetical protein